MTCPASRHFVVWGALGLVTALRLAVAGALPLSPDEAYYWVWSRSLAFGYLDHPAMVALWIRAGTGVLGDTPLGVRVLAPLAAAVGTVLLADAARVLFGPRAALRAAILLNGTVMLAVGAVTMTPDTPLLLFWTVAAWALAHVAAGGGGGWWIVAGAASGLAMESKYTAALLGAAALGLLIRLPAVGRRARWVWPLLGAMAAMATTLPTLVWNASHGWVSILKQGGRVADWAPGRAGRYLLELVGGQLGLATPLIGVLFVIGTWQAARRWREPGPALCAALVLPGAAVFLQHALGDRVQANWAAILYPGCALAAAGTAAAGRWCRPAGILGAAFILLLYVQATLAPLPLPRALDPALRLAGWDRLAEAAAAPGGAFLASEEYGVASLLAWSAPGLPVIAAERRWSMLDLPAAAPAAAGLLLQSARRHEPPDPAWWQSAELLGNLARMGGTRAHPVEVEAFRLYRVVPRPGAPAVSLPQPSR